VHEYFRTSQVPLLAAWGRNDQIFGPDGALAFARDLPNAEINLLDGGHFLLESRLTEVVALIRRSWSSTLVRSPVRVGRLTRGRPATSKGPAARHLNIAMNADVFRLS
jgi:hypothetical protein